MIEFKNGIDKMDWKKLVDLYDETNMFIGLGRERNTQKIQKACENSYRVITAWENGKIIGAGRIISDGECYGWIHDVAVLECYRKQGVGRAIIEKLLEDNENLLIGLTSSFEAVEFYEKLAFKKHKTAMAKYPGPSDYLYD